ncbi:MAG: YetF domain-containing protein [Pyrinomonadaceae bacterium]
MFIEFHLALIEASTWTNMFTLDPENVTWAEKILRPIIVYISLIVLLRIVGKRELAQLNPLDLVVILSLSNTVQNAIIGNGGVVGAGALLLINSSVAYIKYRWPKVEAITEGKPVTLIENGKVNEAVLKSELMTDSDLDIIAHENGFDTADEIDRLILDPNGSFLVDGKDEIKDAKFKRDVLQKIEELSKQLKDLSASMNKAT